MPYNSYSLHTSMMMYQFMCNTIDQVSNRDSRSNGENYELRQETARLEERISRRQNASRDTQLSLRVVRNGENVKRMTNQVQVFSRPDFTDTENFLKEMGNACRNRDPLYHGYLDFPDLKDQLPVEVIFFYVYFLTSN